MASPGNCRASTVLAHFLEVINTPRMVPFDTQDFLLVFYSGLRSRFNCCRVINRQIKLNEIPNNRKNITKS